MGEQAILTRQVQQLVSPEVPATLTEVSFLTPATAHWFTAAPHQHEMITLLYTATGVDAFLIESPLPSGVRSHHE